MKKQNKKNIAEVLFFLGLAAFFLQIAYLIYTGINNGDTQMLRTGLWNIPVFLSILIGFLWRINE